MYAAWQLACVGLQSLEGARENQTATAPFIIHVSWWSKRKLESTK